MANTHSLQLVRASSQYAQAADSSSLSVTGNLTIEFWVKCTTLPAIGIGCPMVFKGDYNTHNSYQTYYYNNAGTPQLAMTFFGADGNTSIAEAKWNYTLTIGTWFHLAFVLTPANSIGTKFEVFVNAASQGNGTTNVVGTTPTSIVDLSVELGLGLNGDPTFLETTYAFDGYFDDVRIWSEARSQANIAANYQTELSGSETNLQAYWKLNNSYSDSTSNGNTLSASGSPSFSTDIPTWQSLAFSNRLIGSKQAVKRASSY